MSGHWPKTEFKSHCEELLEPGTYLVLCEKRLEYCGDEPKHHVIRNADELHMLYVFGTVTHAFTVLHAEHVSTDKLIESLEQVFGKYVHLQDREKAENFPLGSEVTIYDSWFRFAGEGRVAGLACDGNGKSELVAERYYRKIDGAGAWRMKPSKVITWRESYGFIFQHPTRFTVNMHH
jgi:hypothetical protein